MNYPTEICNTFSKHAASYEKAAKIQKEIGQRLFERLDYLTLSPQYILDLGCGTGFFTPQLKKRYPNAHVIGLDLSDAMLKACQTKQRLWRKWSLVQATMLSLPFSQGVFDLVFANQTIHWALSLPGVFQELHRVMRQGGCLMFSTLGPSTFKELTQAWQGADHHAHTNAFADMHDVGDQVLAQGFQDPVVDMEILIAHYDSLKKLLTNIKAQGVRNINPNRNEGLTGKSAWAKFENAYNALRVDDGRFPLTYEVIYGHAWKGVKRPVGDAREQFIPLSEISRS